MGGTGLFRKCRCGNFTVYVWHRTVDEEHGPTEEDCRRAREFPGEYEICWETRYIEPEEIFIYGEPGADVDCHGRQGIHLIAGDT